MSLYVIVPQKSHDHVSATHCFHINASVLLHRSLQRWWKSSFLEHLYMKEENPSFYFFFFNGSVFSSFLLCFKLYWNCLNFLLSVQCLEFLEQYSSAIVLHSPLNYISSKKDGRWINRELLSDTTAELISGGNRWHCLFPAHFLLCNSPQQLHKCISRSVTLTLDRNTRLMGCVVISKSHFTKEL